MASSRRTRPARALRMAAFLIVGVLGGAPFIACAPSLPKPYVAAAASAERAYAHGRYEEAAEHWQRAAETAGSARDRDEALYRAAASLKRAGRHREAGERYRKLAASSPDGERAARAAYEAANLTLTTAGYDAADQPHESRRSAGEDAALEAAMSELRDFAFEYPTSGLARRALQRYTAWLRRTHGVAREIEFLQEATTRLRSTPLEEDACYLSASAHRAAGRTSQAVELYLRTAQRFPYPRGAYWDDALWFAADGELELGRPERALAHLTRLLRERESAHLQGSYERSRFAEAQFRIAEIRRDRLNDAAGAQRAFYAVYADFPSSLLRDDALWQRALLSRRIDDMDTACESMRTLRANLPESRFAHCGHLLCPTMSAAKEPCRHYIERQVETKR